MAVVRELITRLGFGVDQASLNRAEGSINKLSGMLSGIAAFASLRALAGVADSMQSLEARIGMLPQTVGAVGDAFNEVSKHASDNRQSLDAYGTLYNRIGNAAKDYVKTQGDLLKVTDTISQALVVGGATAQEASSVMTQFSQALGAGTLQGEEFRAMAEAAPQYMDELAIALKIPRSEMKKLASEGKITSKQVIEATMKMSSIFEDKFRKMPMTIGAATSIIGNKFKTMVQNMNRESHVVTNVANFFLNAFDRIETGFKSLVDFVGGGTNALKVFGIALLALFGPMALGGFLSILGAILSPAGLVVASLVLLGLAIDDIYTYMQGGQSLFGDFLKDLKNGDVLTVGLTAALLGLTAQFAYVAIAYAAMWAKMRITAMIEGAKVLAIQLAAMGPTGWAIAAGAGIALGAAYLLNKSNDVGLPKVGPGSVTPATMLPNLAPASPTSNTVHQTNNFTMPPGTPQAHINLLETGVVNILGQGNDKLARDMNSMGN